MEHVVLHVGGVCDLDAVCIHMLASCALALRIWRMIPIDKKLERFRLQIAGALLVVAGVVTAAWPSQGASVFTEVSNVMTENSFKKLN